jgi:hypothetical protein
MKAAWTYITTNWKTSLAGLVAFILSVPQGVTAIHQLQAGQKVDWLGTALCLVIAYLGLAAKDCNTHSTQLQVAKASADAVVNSDVRS